MYRLGFLAASGAVIGATLRYLVGEILPADLEALFPFATLTVNVLGSLVIGWCATQASIMEFEARRHFVVTGILGGFTTFSAFAVDLVNLSDSFGLLIGYLLITFGAGLLATHIGWRVGSR